MSGGYYDIDAILTTQQKLPCTFKFDIPGLGHLESSDTKDIKEGSRVELSYWLAELLAIRYSASDTLSVQELIVAGTR
ncbi:DNA replication complex GINS protein psf-3 [Taphrina deformans PYCC 5710]|uniref:DNA replication complex GINS protein PSF3 n=1 Tax=Taphrina deformans (strain PYCC 5710 / ATCC 11124 / CBS 356.35 / IMI 108563 / JCM 9778 / NBRC 8474) TaxID=1097556 RepID=R4XEI6_TAPDE|nr:DNA replication complex GINS protein psf-3 [Taphrina deformans PYCC 5710]|eukprot:CCG81782.1 DNA replication complex GINS protein psf-3 [Taphrina deformans PYCC 5710]